MPVVPNVQIAEKPDQKGDRLLQTAAVLLLAILTLPAGFDRVATAQGPTAAEDATGGKSAEARPLTVDIVARGTSSRSARNDALARLPLGRLNPDQLAQVNHVLENRSMFRRLPTIAIDAAPEVYTHFTHNPESAVGIWRALGISKFTMQQTGPSTWYGDAGDGSTGTIHVLDRTPHRHLLLCEGQYKSPLLTKPIRATAVMHLQTKYGQDENQQPKIVHDLDLFVMFPSQTIDTVVRVIAPVSHMIADRNFRELSLFVRFMNVAMERQPGWLEQTIQRVDGITREQRLDLMKVSAKVYVAARNRAESGGGVERANLDALITPYRVTPASGEALPGE